MQIHTINHRSSHHAQNSGYDRLLDYITSNKIPSKKPIIPYRLAKQFSSSCNQDYGIYDSNSVFKDYELCMTLMRNNKHHHIVHYLHAERDIRFVINNSQWFKGAKFCGTFHKPPNVLKDEIKNTKYVERLDSVIAVGANQVDFLRNWLNIENVSYIPHGVDTNYFSPKLVEKELPVLLFVGQHLRDFESLNYVAKVLKQRNRKVTIQVVLRKEFAKFIDNNSLVEVFSNIDDETLRLLYQHATLLFLPLLDSTACNSLLEAMACGLPIVTTEVGGNAEYLSGTANFLAPNKDVDCMLDAIDEILQNEELQSKMKKISRQKALRYDWNIIADEIQQFYITLAK